MYDRIFYMFDAFQTSDGATRKCMTKEYHACIYVLGIQVLHLTLCSGSVAGCTDQCNEGIRSNVIS